MVSPHATVARLSDGRKSTGMLPGTIVAEMVVLPSRGSSPLMASSACALTRRLTGLAAVTVGMRKLKLTFTVACALTFANVVVIVLPASWQSWPDTEGEHFKACVSAGA